MAPFKSTVLAFLVAAVAVIFGFLWKRYNIRLSPIGPNSLESPIKTPSFDTAERYRDNSTSTNTEADSAPRPFILPANRKEYVFVHCAYTVPVTAFVQEADTSFHVPGYYCSSKFTDLTIKTDDKERKVHKVVVCVQSEYFSLMLEEKWEPHAVNNTVISYGAKQETSNDIISISVDYPGAIGAMIDFLYEGDYSIYDETIPDALNHLRMYKLADRYGIPQLKSCAKEKFRNTAENNITSWGMDVVKQVNREVYTDAVSGGDTGLCDILIQIIIYYLKTLSAQSGFIHTFDGLQGFAYQIIVDQGFDPENRDDYTCKNKACKAPYTGKRWAGDEGRYICCPRCGKLYCLKPREPHI
ncbi:hypothetical protein AJ79_04949 [Helicocarpus griseus UAMH5409]|uniref:BTB domain-containing protein n=1 Tax=Helicocarpus griseus UAMH5409 TaxID=1447875 RepID=A0A2B7XRE6_9EURO|nr:hypothetical protein AJ79_04949 [Helicocarpus griseus UAMH5409]